MKEKKRVQLLQDLFGTPIWRPFHCFGTPIWPPFHCFGTPIWQQWRHVKTLYYFPGCMIVSLKCYPSLHPTPNGGQGERDSLAACWVGAKTLLRHIRFCLKTEMRFFSVFKKINPRLHVAFFNRFCSWTRKCHSDWQQYHLMGACPYNGHSIRDDIFLKSLRFQPSTREL